MKAAKITRPAVASLMSDAIRVGSVSAPWEDLRGWTAYGGEQCQTCGAVVVLTTGQGGEAHKHCAATACDGYVPMFEGPAMSYAYELPGFQLDPYDAATAIAHLPLCLIEWDDTDDRGHATGRDGWALALTGGGMDLSWEIAEAFMCLGYLPPLKYAGRLPDYGRGRGAQRYVLQGARKAIQVARTWLANDARAVAQLAAKFRAKGGA
jgi:hypothetical protein